MTMISLKLRIALMAMQALQERIIENAFVWVTDLRGEGWYFYLSFS